MHLNVGRQEIIHDDDTDVLLVALVHVHPKELWEQCMRILVQVHVVAGQELLQELGLLVLDSLQDEFVVVRQVEDGAGRSGIAQLNHGLAAYRHQKVVTLDTEQLQEVAESQRGVRAERVLAKRVRGRLVRPIFREVGRLHCHKVLHQQVALVVLVEGSYSVTNSQLDRPHQLVSRYFFVRHFACLVDPPVANFAVLVVHLLVGCHRVARSLQSHATGGLLGSALSRVCKDKQHGQCGASS